MTFRKKLILMAIAVLVVSASTAAVALARNGSGATNTGTVQAGGISADQAGQLAAKASGTPAGAVELNDENGVQVYGVQAGGKEMKIDAGTGQVLKSEDESADGQKGAEAASESQSGADEKAGQTGTQPETGSQSETD